MTSSLTVRRTLRTALWLTLGVLGLWLVQFLVPARRSIPPHVTVSFLGYTNAPPGTTLAVFGITNRANSGIRILNGCDIEIEGKRIPLPSTTPFRETTLGRGEGMTAVIGLPPRQGKWRARWGVSRNTLSERLLSLRDKYQWRVFLGGHLIYGVDTEWLPP